MEGKVSLEQAMEMSLDEYINIVGIKGCGKSKKYKAKNTSDAESLDLDLEHELPSSNSSQWRLLPPNIGEREPGMPPLIPINSRMPYRQNQQGNNRRWKYNDRDYCNMNSYDTREIQIELDNNRFNGRRRGRNRGSKNQGPYSRGPHKNMSSVQHRLNIKQNPSMNMPPFQNNFMNDFAFRNPMNNLMALNHQFFNPLANGNFLNSNMGSTNDSHATSKPSAPLGMNFLQNNLELVPALAGKILEQLDTVQKNLSNKYDMKLQKEISEIQGNTLFFKCGGDGGVVSFDGPGVNCSAAKHTTDTSLNQRFA